ncbi:MAG TPA: carbohydrate binding family 9 domain-containing protein [Terracidiphilus sp.]
MSALGCYVSPAQKSGVPANTPQPPRAQPPSDFKVPLLTQPVRLSDFTNMEPPPELKGKLAEVTGFIQNMPNDGEPASQRTHVWIGHTKSTLYFVFACFDDHPGDIRGHLTRREAFTNQSDDSVSVLLDPFQDRRKGVLFSVNPAGVQADAGWTDTPSVAWAGDADYSYDQVWDSEARVTSQGWMALIAIPFRSIRFRTASSEWGVVFYRSLPRNSEYDFWPRVSTSISGVLTQEATMRGIEGVTASHNLQINPYVLGQNERELVNLDPMNPYFSSRRAEGTAGGEAKLIIKDSVVIDGTINPDFSDVESDQPQFTVNQRYPVYFPELRPFFLENANYFATPILLVYTRNIVHPEYGIRLTGKLGQTNLGFFAIDDREPGELSAPGDPLYHKRARYSVARISQDLGSKGSSIGLIYTDEEFGGGWNRIGGLDFNARISPSWSVIGQVVESSSKGPLPDSPGSTSYSAGPASFLEVQRTGHAFNLDSINKDYSSGFQTQLGFIPTTNIYNDQTQASYQWFPKIETIQSVGIQAMQQLAWDHQGNRVYHYTTVAPFMWLPRQFKIAPQLGQNSDTLGPQDGTLLTHNENFTQNFGGLIVSGAPYRQFNFFVDLNRGGYVNFNPVAGGLPTLTNSQVVEALASIQPIRQLTIDNTYLLDREYSAATSAFVYEVQTFRTKINYQFTRSISARVITEYDSTLVNPAETSLSRRKQIGTQALFTWLPHPGTVLYVGYNNDLQNLDRALCNRGLNGTCDPTNPIPPRSNNYLNDGKQLFVKFSYLFRF